MAAAAIAQAHVKRNAESSTSSSSSSSSFGSENAPSHVQAIMKSKFEAASRLRQTARQQDVWTMALAGAWASPDAAMVYAPAVLNRRLAEMFYIARENRLKGNLNLLSGLHYAHLPRLEAGAHNVMDDALKSAEKELLSDINAPIKDIVPHFAMSPLPWPGTQGAAAVVDASEAFKTAGLSRTQKKV